MNLLISRAVNLLAHRRWGGLKSSWPGLLSEQLWPLQLCPVWSYAWILTKTQTHKVTPSRSESEEIIKDRHPLKVVRNCVQNSRRRAEQDTPPKQVGR